MRGSKYGAFLGLLVFIILAFTATVLYTPHGTSRLAMNAISKKWRADYSNATEIVKCKDFNTLQGAISYFGAEYFSHFQPCKNYQSDKRVIAFYDAGNIHGFLTCYTFSKSDYFCCAQIARGYTKDYNTWKQRCS